MNMDHHQDVQAVTANQLFATPTELAARMVALAGIEQGDRVLEPSVGTGRIYNQLPEHCKPRAICVEISAKLCENLKGLNLINRDFLSMGIDDFGWLDGDKGFDIIIMNPPFENADDIKHIKHALTMLNDGGILVAICAGGPRQKEALEPIASSWEPLPAGTFKESGTGVASVLLTIRK